MKLRFLIQIILLAFFAQAGLPQQANPPLTKDQVMDLVKFGMDSTELAKRIKERGIDFEPTDDYLESLRKAGVQEPVIQAIRELKPKPLTREQVGKLIAGGVPSERAAALVKQHGINFEINDKYLDTLRVAGAGDTLIAALRKASTAVPAELVVITSPNAEVCLDGELQGRANGQGELVLKAQHGTHALKVSLQGKEDFEQNVTLAAQQATRIEARLEDVSPPRPGTVRENPKDGLKYVWIPPGTFMMGCSPGDNLCTDDEKPAHRVTITKGFWMGQTEVTVGAYKRFAVATGRQMPNAPRFNSGWTNDNMPVVSVTWNEAHEYCPWAGGRLATEAEWEYAARAGSTAALYGPIDETAWYYQNSGNDAREVAQKRANAFGVFDVLGNVWEWVNDFWDAKYYQSSPSQDPKGPANGQERVLRGGSFFNGLGEVSVTIRSHGLGPTPSDYGVGFRCAREVSAP
jgi:formylglycine-generating enzyme required for sulfatase activity